MYMANCAQQVVHYCKTESETSGKNTPYKIYITRAGREIMMAGFYFEVLFMHKSKMGAIAIL